MDFSTINCYLDLAKTLLIHFYPYRNSFPTNNSFPCLSNNCAKDILLISFLKSGVPSPLKISSRQWRLRRIKEMKQPRRNSQKNVLRRKSRESFKKIKPSYSSKSYISNIFYLSLWTFPSPLWLKVSTS